MATEHARARAPEEEDDRTPEATISKIAGSALARLTGSSLIDETYARFAPEEPGGGMSETSGPAVAEQVADQSPIDADLVEVAGELTPGKALDLGCGIGQNSLWLAGRGWTVTGVDDSPGAIADARSTARTAGLRTVFEVADITAWRPASRFDLVISTFALPERGRGRGRMLDMAAAAVAPGGCLLVKEYDISMSRDGWMAEKYLVSLEELERHLGGFLITRSAVRMSRVMYGFEERVMPVATVVATRRTDLFYR